MVLQLEALIVGTLSVTGTESHDEHKSSTAVMLIVVRMCTINHHQLEYMSFGWSAIDCKIIQSLKSKSRNYYQSCVDATVETVSVGVDDGSMSL